jgi:hypothetical protein
MTVPASLPRFPQAGTGLLLFHGDAACLTVGLLVGLRAATPNRPLLVVDGANSLDPYLLADLARRLKQPPAGLLASVFISRLWPACSTCCTTRTSTRPRRAGSSGGSWR